MTERRISFFRVCVCVRHSDSVEKYLVTVDRLDLGMDKNFKKKKTKKEKNINEKTLRGSCASEKFCEMYPWKFNS